jgi:Na+/melibiose symporter-like transporter
MKSISASIVVLSGALLLVGGSFVPHDQTQVFVQFVGCVVGLIGLVAWWLAFKQSRD